jgi:uncharacterized OB-fold protein
MTTESKKIVWTGATGERPVPDLNEPDTGQFWRRANQHELVYNYCRDCQQVIFYPRAHCTGCLSGAVETRVSRGLGVVYSYTVIRRNPDPAFSDEVPYVLAFVDLEEGFRLLTRLVAEPSEVSVGQQVEVCWLSRDGVELPAFAPRGRDQESRTRSGT